MKATKRTATLAGLTLAGCAATVQPIQGPSGSQAYSIDCTNSETWQACYVKAGEVCGAEGSRIVDKSGGQQGAGWPSYYGYGGYSYMYATRTLMVECGS